MNTPQPHDTPLLVSKRAMDIVVALLLLLLAAVVMVESANIGYGWEEGVGPAAGFFPFLVAAMLAVSSLYTMVMGILGKTEDAEEEFITLTGLTRILYLTVPLIAFVAAIHFIGIYVASALFIAGFMMAFGHNGVLKSIGVGIGVPLVLFMMFEKWFLVPLPKGPLEAMLGY